MPIHRDKERGNFVFEFDRRLKGKRIRIRKYLPKTWNKSQADAFDRQESARLYAIASEVERPDHLIDDAVDIYIAERVPLLKSGSNIARELAQMYFAYKGLRLQLITDRCHTLINPCTSRLKTVLGGLFDVMGSQQVSVGRLRRIEVFSCIHRGGPISLDRN